jgi:hypothetical protein
MRVSGLAGVLEKLEVEIGVICFESEKVQREHLVVALAVVLDLNEIHRAGGSFGPVNNEFIAEQV